MMPSSASFSLNVVATDTLSKTASTATPTVQLGDRSGALEFDAPEGLEGGAGTA